MVKKKPGISNVSGGRTGKVVPFRKKKNKKKIFITILLLLVVVGVTLFTPIFNIKAINVVGNAKIKQEDIVTTSGITTGQNIFRFNYFKAKNNILEQPYIESVKISRDFPSTIVITVNERKPAAFFEYMGSYLIIDGKGIVLELVDALNDLKIPSVLGIKFKDYKCGKKISVNKEDQEKFDTVLICLNEIAVNKLEQIINKIDITDINKIVAWAYNDKFQVNLIDNKEMPYKFKFLAKMLDMEKKENANWVIDFTTPSKPSLKPRY